MLYAIAKGMDQNIVALHATNDMLDKDAKAIQGGIGRCTMVLLRHSYAGKICVKCFDNFFSLQLM
jgi:hypothetical protein